MLHYIEKSEIIRTYKQDTEASYIIDLINNITAKTDRSWLSTLENDLINILYENNDDKDQFYRDPYDFFNVLTNNQIKDLLSDYKEEIEYYYFNNVNKLDLYTPEELPNMEIFRDFPDRIYSYYFDTVLWSVVHWLLS